jgi:hypothetical protein
MRADRWARWYSCAGLLARALTISLGLTAVAWASFSFADASNQIRLTQIANEVMDGDDTEPALPSDEEVKKEASYVAPFGLSNPKARRALVMIRLRLAEYAFLSGDEPEIKRRLEDAKGAVQAYLDISPSDSYLWLALFWIRSVESGFMLEDLALLRFSYQFGPREGWVALKRNQISLKLLPFFDAELEDMALAEFAGLVESGFSEQSAELLIGPGWPNHEQLLSRLELLPRTSRQDLAVQLRRRSYYLNIPGVENAEARPWN